MRQEHLARLESTVDEVKASTLNAKHLQQELSNVPLKHRFIWTDKSVAKAFVSAYGGRITDKHATIPWRLLYCRKGEFVAYVKEYKIATPEGNHE